MTREADCTVVTRPGGPLHGAESRREGGVKLVRASCQSTWRPAAEVAVYDYRYRLGACRHPACRLAFFKMEEADRR